MTNEILKSRISPAQKAQALVKIGVTPYEAMCLAQSWMPIKKERKPRKAPFSYTFGVEIECCNCAPDAFIIAAEHNGLTVENRLMQYAGCHTDIPVYKLVPDGSLSGYNTAECVTPALNGKKDGFDSLKRCCDSLARVGAKVNKSCGLHVHIGAANLTEEAYCNVFVNYMYLEAAIDSFMAPSRRGNEARWCRTLTNNEGGLLRATTREQVSSALGRDRYHKVNAESWLRHKTIEFRQHQGSTMFLKISHWVKFLGKLVEYSRENRLDQRIDHIEDIPFLTRTEKKYFIERRASIATVGQ